MHVPGASVDLGIGMQPDRALRRAKVLITGAEHGQPAARQQGGAVAQPLPFTVGGEKYLRGRCREVFAARSFVATL